MKIKYLYLHGDPLDGMVVTADTNERVAVWWYRPRTSEIVVEFKGYEPMFSLSEMNEIMSNINRITTKASIGGGI